MKTTQPIEVPPVLANLVVKYRRPATRSECIAQELESDQHCHLPTVLTELSAIAWMEANSGIQVGRLIADLRLADQDSSYMPRYVVAGRLADLAMDYVVEFRLRELEAAAA